MTRPDEGGIEVELIGVKDALVIEQIAKKLAANL